MSMPERGAVARVGARVRDAMFGLSADFPKVVELELARIRPNPDQPRRTVEPEALADLARSIERHGLLQPIVVRALDERTDHYLLVAGQRRFLAHRSLGRETIFAIVTDGDADELALIENLQREDLSPIDEADAMARLMARHRYTQEQLGQVLGRRQSTISESLSLAGLPETIKEDYRTSDNPVAKAVLVELARIRPPDRQLELWQELREGGTLRQLRARRAGTTPESVARVLAQGQRFVQALEQLPGEEVGRPDRPYLARLVELRARVDALIRRHDAGRDEVPGP